MFGGAIYCKTTKLPSVKIKINLFHNRNVPSVSTEYVYFLIVLDKTTTDKKFNLPSTTNESKKFHKWLSKRGVRVNLGVRVKSAIYGT